MNCPTCEGSGEVEIQITCNRCRGTGMRNGEICCGGVDEMDVPCEECNGTGKVEDEAKDLNQDFIDTEVAALKAQMGG